MLTFDSLLHMLEELQTETDCRQFLEELRWKGKPVCPHCGSISDKHYKLKEDGVFEGQYKCRDCRKRFTVTMGTMFEKSHVSLKKWFYAIYLFTSHKKGISSVQLAKDIKVSQKTAWYMLSRMRYNFRGKIKVPFNDMTQIDETYVGGRNHNKHKRKKGKGTQGRSKVKSIVMGLRSGEGLVGTIVIPDAKAKTLLPIIDCVVRKGSTIITDGWRGYNKLSKKYIHKVVDHSKKEYVIEGGFTTNGIENFWSHLKRGIIGIYHVISAKHLEKYCDEFGYRYNTRHLSGGERFNLFLVEANDRLKYKHLINKR